DVLMWPAFREFRAQRIEEGLAHYLVPGGQADIERPWMLSDGKARGAYLATHSRDGTEFDPPARVDAFIPDEQNVRSGDLEAMHDRVQASGHDRVVGVHEPQIFAPRPARANVPGLAWADALAVTDHGEPRLASLSLVEYVSRAVRRCSVDGNDLDVTKGLL